MALLMANILQMKGPQQYEVGDYLKNPEHHDRRERTGIGFHYTQRPTASDQNLPGKILTIFFLSVN